MNSSLLDVDRIKPQHKVCETNVDVPTIIVEPLEEGREPQVLVQWFGEFSAADFLQKEFGNAVVERFQRMQFRFPVPIPVDDMHWMLHPERFKVILLAQVKDWPNKKAIPELGKPDSWILWLASSHYGTDDGPACFAVPFNVMLGDQLCGIISPRKYCDVNVLEREKQAYDALRGAE